MTQPSIQQATVDDVTASIESISLEVIEIKQELQKQRDENKNI